MESASGDVRLAWRSPVSVIRSLFSSVMFFSPVSCQRLASPARVVITCPIVTTAHPRQVVGSRDGAWDFSPGFHPLPHRTGHEVFPHPALRQPSSWSIQAIHCHDFSITCHIRSSRSMFAFWLSSIVCAGVLVICLVVELAFQHAPSLTSSLNLVEVETLPSE